MKASVQFRSYERTFKHPFHTAHGVMDKRHGLLLRLVCEDGKIGFGEIAPLGFFHTESYLEAVGYCDWMPSSQESYFLEEIPDSLPCVRYGFESAWRMIDRGEQVLNSFPVCRLISSDVCNVEQSINNMKLKVGKGDDKEEQEGVLTFLERLPMGGSVRLDANEAWNREKALAWFTLLKPYADKIQCVEQPCACGEESFMAELQEEFGLQVALDESIAKPEGLRRVLADGWAGLFVIKPAVWGSLKQLETMIEPVMERVILSSALETSVGLWPLLDLAQRGGQPLGIDTAHLFEDSMGWKIQGGVLDPSVFQMNTYERIWTHIGNY